MKYLKRYWNESRGDSHDDWGRSWWYFEIDAQGNVLRQVEEYENDMICRYDVTRFEDEFGGLSRIPIKNTNDGYEEIIKEEFERLWNEK